MNEVQEAQIKYLHALQESEERRELRELQQEERRLKEREQDKRDMFAACALSGLLANSSWSGNERDFASWAYKSADAMMEARKK